MWKYDAVVRVKGIASFIALHAFLCSNHIAPSGLEELYDGGGFYAFHRM
jgi:hypothetical protein